MIVHVKAKAGARVQVESKELSEGTLVITEETGKRGSGRKPPRVF